MLKFILIGIIVVLVIGYIKAGKEMNAEIKQSHERIENLHLGDKAHSGFHGDLIAVNNSTTGRRWGLMNDKGVWVVPPRYDSINWSEKRGGCWECVESIVTGKTEYFDMHGGKSFDDDYYTVYARQQELKRQEEELRKKKEQEEQERICKMKSQAHCRHCKYAKPDPYVLYHIRCRAKSDKYRASINTQFMHPFYCEEYEPKD